MKSLSAANQTNIAATFQDPAILVEIPDISKQWSSKTKSGYETRIMDISPIRQEVDPLGGVASLSDFTVTIQQETPSQFVQDLEPDNQNVDIFLQYGSDPKIRIIRGRLDNWTLEQGRLTLECIGNIQLSGQSLPIQQILEDEFSSFRIPDRSVGKWVPVTLGDMGRARGYLIDWEPGAQKIKFNAAVSGHEAIGEVTDGWTWQSGIEEYVRIKSSLSAATAGHLLVASGTHEDDGFVELSLTTIPVHAVSAQGANALDGFNDTNDAVDDDFGTYASAKNVAPVGGGTAQTTELATVRLRCRLPQLPFPEGIIVIRPGPTLAPGGIWVLYDLERVDPNDGSLLALNDGDASSEVLRASIEVEEGTFPVPSFADDPVLATGQAARDNLNQLDQAETDTGLSVPRYAIEFGNDTDGDDVGDELPVRALGERHLTLSYTEEQFGSSRVDKELRVREVRLRIDMKGEVEQQDYYGEIGGYDDDGSGTYTGTANALIENGADVVHFILDQLLDVSGIDTAEFASVRSTLGNYHVAGQVLRRTDARRVLDELCRQAKLKLFLDFEDQWTVSTFEIPTSEDRHLQQDQGDFVGDDEKGEGEIKSVRLSPLDELYNQFEILFAWDEARGTYQERLVLDENTSGVVGDWLTDSQARWNTTRKLTIEADWIRKRSVAEAFGHYLIHLLADRKRVVTFQSSFNSVDLEIGDVVRLTHTDLKVAEDTEIHAGYVTSDGSVVEAGENDPDTGSTYLAGAHVELHEGRHYYEIHAIETDPFEGKIRFTARQIDAPNTLGQVPAESDVSATSPPADSTPSVPGQVTGLTVSNVTRNTADLSWDDLADEDFYDIALRNIDEGEESRIVKVNPSDDTTYTLRGLNASDQYGVKVRGGNAGGVGDFSAESTIRAGRAEITGLEIGVNDDGQAVVSVTGNEDVSTIYVTVGDGSTPSDPTAGSNDGSISGRSGAVDTGVAITVGNQAIVKAVAEDPEGILGPVQENRVRRGVGKVTKTLRVNAADLDVAADSGYDYLFESDTGVLKQRTGATNSVYIAAVKMPVGVTLTKFSARMYRETTSDAASAELKVVDDTPSRTILSTVTHGSTGWSTESDSTLSHTTLSNRTYFVAVQLTASSSDFDARHMWLEFEYEAADVDQTL